MSSMPGRIVAAKRCRPPPPPPPPPPAPTGVTRVVHPPPPPALPQHSYQRRHVANDKPIESHGSEAARQQQLHQQRHQQQARNSNGHRPKQHQHQPQQQQSHHHRVAVAPSPPPPPPPPVMTSAAPTPQSAYASDVQKSYFHSSKFGGTYSCDSSDFGRSYDANSSITSNNANNDSESLLSAKLKPFLNLTKDDASGILVDTSIGIDIAGDDQKKDCNNSLLFSPTQMDETNDITLLHSVFSPKFHDKSAKKQLRSHNGNNDKQTTSHRQKHYTSKKLATVFSPVSSTSETEDGVDDVSAMSGTSAGGMSDEFGTINAILRGDTLENIKRHLGLDDESHPLSPKPFAREVEGREERADGSAEAKPRVELRVHIPAARGDKNNNMDDSTEVMLDKARLLANSGASGSRGTAAGASTEHQYQNIFSPPSGNQASSKKATLNVTPTSEDEFFTPKSFANPTQNDFAAEDRSSGSPMALNFDVGRMSGGKGLTPVWEEEETKSSGNKYAVNLAGPGQYQTNHGRMGDASMDSMSMGDFSTPKQHDNDWKRDDHSGNFEEEDDEEFFSPLVQHTVHTPTTKHSLSDSANQLGSLALALHSLNSSEQLSLTQSMVPSSNIPVASPAPIKATSSTKVDQDLQSMLNDTRGVTQPEELKLTPQQAPSTVTSPTFDSNLANAGPKRVIATPSPISSSWGHNQAPSPILQSPSFHLHSPCVSSLPPDALTVDFVKQCGCTATLKAILSMLSDDNNTNHRNGGKRGKLLRYPSLVRLVEKRLQKMEKELEQHPKEEQQQSKVGNEYPVLEKIDHHRPRSDTEQPMQVQPHITMGRKGLHDSRIEGGDDDNVDPESYLDALISKKEITIETPTRPMESITVSHDSSKSGEGKTGSPSFSDGFESSLDMNLSESLFTLDDESFYWNQPVDSSGKKVVAEKQLSLIAEKNMSPNQVQHNAPQVEAGDDLQQRYAELKEKLASTLTSNAQLTGELDSLANEHNGVKKELSSKIKQVTKQISQFKVSAAANKEAQQEQIGDLETANEDLRHQVQRLHEQLNLFKEETEDAARAWQTELKEARVQQSTISLDKQMLGQELEEMRSMYEKSHREVARLRLLLDKNATSEGAGTARLQQGVESAKLANKALANALAVSETDLAEAIESKKKSERECHIIRDRATKLEDKTAFLSSQVKEMKKELESSHAYIDQLYVDLGAKSSPSKEMKADFERKEMEWMELERGYSQRIQELEGRLVYDPQNQKVSMDAYMSVVKQTRHYKFESMKNEQTIDELKTNLGDLREQLDKMQKSSPNRAGGNKQKSSPKRVGGNPLRVLQAVSPGNDENTPPPAPREQLPSVKQQQGKQLSRVAAIKAAGGRKGLSEQLKRSRRFGGKAHNVGTED